MQSKTTESSTESAPKEIDRDLIEQAKELVRGAEVLPDGAEGLARKMQDARDAGRLFRAKLGIDPTATDLHLGHAVLFRKLKRFQEFGHQVVLIIGGFTAQIGDPSGRSATRPPLTEADVAANAQTYLDQIGLILDLKKVEVRNNVEWLKPLGLHDLLRLASYVTINRLITKEAFGERLDKQLPVFFHELFYPLLQGYDSVAIKADIELGGTDQRFNILQGRELQPYYGQEAQMAMLLPLLEGTDGVKKMSKSFNNYIGLREPASDMFGKCMRIPDDLIVKYFEYATDLVGADIDAIKTSIAGGGNPKDAKLRLASEVLKQYWGEDAAKHELDQWDKVHSQKQLPTKEEMQSFAVQPGTQLFRILAESGLAASSSEAKRLVKENAVKFEGEVISDPNHVLYEAASDGGADLGVLQVSRRKFVFLVKGQG